MTRAINKDMNKAIHKVQHCENMQDVRRAINALDDILVPLLVERVGYMSQAARIKPLATQVRDEARIEDIVARVRAQAEIEGGDAQVIEEIYRSMMEACIAFEHREFARLRKTSEESQSERSIANGPGILQQERSNAN